uniref:Uncharacterized protein n=1 Tax=Chenopodium quinoa TaxID=63459 RepID=A0A803LTF8_CHEQI
MEHPTTLCIADLGCSSSEQNCLSGLAYGLIETIDKARRGLGHGGPQEYHICLNDLPGNDFNTVFTSVTSFKDRLKQQLGDNALFNYASLVISGIAGKQGCVGAVWVLASVIKHGREGRCCCSTWLLLFCLAAAVLQACCCCSGSMLLLFWQHIGMQAAAVMLSAMLYA